MAMAFPTPERFVEALIVLTLAGFAVGLVLGTWSGVGWQRIDTRYWRHMHDLEARDARDLRSRLEDAMARKPLTDEQLAACVAAGGGECPRCGNDEENDYTEDDAEDDDLARVRAWTCPECAEAWTVRYRLKAEAAGATEA